MAEAVLNALNALNAKNEKSASRLVRAMGVAAACLIACAPPAQGQTERKAKPHRRVAPAVEQKDRVEPKRRAEHKDRAERTRRAERGTPRGVRSAPGARRALPREHGPHAVRVAGWEGVSAEGFLLAEESARREAVSLLARRIESLHLSPHRRVGHFVATSPAIREALYRPFPGIAYSEGVFLPDGVCTVRAEVDLAVVIDCLKTLNARYGDGRYRAEDFDRTWSLNRVDRLVAVGRGVPPLVDLPPPGHVVVGRRPAWVETVHREIGHGVAPAGRGSSVQGKLLAARRAKDSALQRLADHVRGLRLFVGSDRTVGDELDADPVAAARFVDWLHRAETIRTQWSHGGAVTVEIEADLRGLWEVVRPRYRTPPPDEPQLRIRPIRDRGGSVDPGYRRPRHP